MCPALGQCGFSAREEVGRELSTPANCSTKGIGTSTVENVSLKVPEY